MATTSVQFRSIDSVIQAYQSRQCAPYSIYQDKQFMFKSESESIDEGTEMLQKHLAALARSAAIYTLKVYEDLEGKIKSNTPDDGSFNFRFNEYAEGGGGNGNSAMNEVLTELRTLKMQIAQNQEEEPEEEESRLGVIGEVLALPGVGEAVAAIIPVLVGKFINGHSVPAAPAVLAGVPGAAISNLAEAIEVLKVCDAAFEVHMIKLATLARDNPKKFATIIGMMKFI